MENPNNAKKANAEALDVDNRSIAQITNLSIQSMSVVTVLRTKEPCNKRIVLNGETGSPEKVPLAQITCANAKTLEVSDAVALKSLLEEVSENPNMAVTLCSFEGISAGDSFVILSARKMRERLRLPENSPTPNTAVQLDGQYYTTREKKNCIPSNWTYFDYDKVKGMPEELVVKSPDEWLGMMDNLVPGFSEADKILVRSSSSRISYHGEPAFDGGWHCFVQVMDAADVEDFGKRLLIHSLSTKYGFMREIFSSDTGEVVGNRPWTVFDPTTFSRERLLFEGKPVVECKGLTVKAADIQIIGGKS